MALFVALAIAERRHELATMAALGAPLREIGAFVWSEAALVLGAGLVLAAGLGWLLATMLVAMLTARLRPAAGPRSRSPGASSAALGGAALVAALLASRARRAPAAAAPARRHPARAVRQQSRRAHTAAMATRACCVVEDDADAARALLGSGLEEEGFDVRAVAHRRPTLLAAARAASARTRWSSTSACPTPTAATSARRCARAASTAPVLFLTARDALADRLVGLQRRRRRLPDQAVRASPSCRPPAGAAAARRRRRRRRSARPAARPGDPRGLVRRASRAR